MDQEGSGNETDEGRLEAARQSTLFNQSLEKGFAVIEAFGAEFPSMSLPEIAKATGITKSAAQRLAYTLEALGYLRKDPQTKRYSLAPKSLGFAYRYLLASPLVERANPYLLEVNRTIRETVNLSEPEGLEMVFTARFPSPIHSIVHMPIGRRLPMYCTASGRAYLSLLPDSHVRNIIEASDRVKYTPTTKTDVAKLIALIQEAREKGYAWSNQEYYRGDLNIAVALVDTAGNPVGAINISAAASRWTLDDLRKKGAPLLIEAARKISTSPPTPKALAPFHRGYGIVDSAIRNQNR
ncbi:helix-turn-helix domain-containing protein [Candidimonas humi]|jgi:DNA-binding IclR family transcriptional regulator|nr:helix-turn-helix domain-containing protein [Candidimonas humi]